MSDFSGFDGSGARDSDPFQSAPLVGPDVAHNQDRQEDHHFRHTKPSQRLVSYGPGEQEYGLHIENHEQDGDNVEAHRIAPARIRGGLDAAFVGFELGQRWRRWPDQFGHNDSYGR